MGNINSQSIIVGCQQEKKTKLSFSSSEDSCSTALASSADSDRHMCPTAYSGGGLAHKCRLFATGAVVVLGGSFHFGYQISLINPMADVLQAFLERGLKE